MSFIACCVLLMLAGIAAGLLLNVVAGLVLMVLGTGGLIFPLIRFSESGGSGEPYSQTHR